VQANPTKKLTRWTLHASYKPFQI